MPVDGDIILKAGLDSTGVSKKIEELQKSIRKGLRNIIRVGFGVRSVFALIRKMRSALFEGFGDLAQVHEPFNQAMSSIMTSLKLLRNTFASAFAPIVETVAPILTAFINKIADAVSAIGQFIAALTGKEYVRAGAVYQDYAASLDKSTASSKKSTSATKKQTEAQKKLNREITHFDDLVILHDKEKDDTDTDTPTVSTPASGFSTAPIGSAVSKFAQDFKAAWANADFTDIGRIVGEKLKNALENIPWNGIKENLSKIGKSVATFLNGFLETPGLFNTIGKTIANAIDAAVVLAESFVWNFHWDSLGIAVREMITSALNNINWNRIYHTVNGFAIGLATYLNELFKPETFEAVGATAAELLNTAFEFLNTFGDNFDFTQFGSSLAAGINKFLNKFNTARFTSGINTFVTGFHDAVVSFLKNVDWYDFGLKVRNIILGINWKQVLISVGDMVWKAINSAILVMKGLFDTDNISTPFTDALEDLSTTIQEAAENIDFESLSEGFDSLVTALAPAIEGFGAGFIEVLNTFVKLGESFLNSLGPAMQSIADALNDMDPDLLESIGIGLGVIAGAFTVMTIINTVVTGIQTFVGLLSTLLGPISTFIGTAGTTTVGSAIAGGTGLLGISSGFILLSGAAIGAIAGIALFKEDIVDTKSELSECYSEFSDTKSIVEQVGTEFGLTSDEVNDLAGLLSNVSEETKNVDGVYNLFDQHLQDAGVDVGDFKSALADAASTAQNSQKNISGLQGYIDNVATSSSQANTDTSDFANAFDLFNGLSITAPLKLALLSAAIKSLGDKGALSDEDINTLYSTLDNYNTSPTEKNMGKVETAFENAGVSADDFMQALTTSVATMDPAVGKEIGKAVKTIDGSGSKLKSSSKDSFKNVGDGAKEGLDAKSSTVADAAGDMVDDSFNEMNKRADAHSPSKRAQQLGTNIDEGLQLGLSGKGNIIVQAAGTIITSVLTKIRSFYNSFTTAGQTLANDLYNGFNSKSTNLATLASNIGTNMYNKFTSLSFYSVGSNIATGIYNGLFNNKEWLNTLAWNTAVGMYNSACAALSISSPSKKFAWIGEMVTQGLGNGILDNEDDAVDAVTNMTSAMTDEAEKANPAVSVSTSIDSWIDSLDEVLTKFSDTVITRFDNLINTLSQLSNISANVPAVAQGFVVPSAIRSNNSSDAMVGVTRMLENLSSNQMTPDDLRPLLVEMFTEYMNLGWYIGDEQLARHTNNGNLILNRRYSTIKV